MNSEEIFEKLRARFSQSEHEWRVQQSGFAKNGKPWAMILCYVDARAIQNRLDAVVGPQNWSEEYEIVDGNFKCKLGIRIEGEWVYKVNGAPETDMEGFKGGFSKSFVRVASNWGIGRYLYDLEATWANFVDRSTPGAKKAMIKKNKEDKYGEPHFWLPPKMFSTEPTTNQPEQPPQSEPQGRFNPEAVLKAFSQFGYGRDVLEDTFEKKVEEFTLEDRQKLSDWYLELKSRKEKGA